MTYGQALENARKQAEIAEAVAYKAFRTAGVCEIVAREQAEDAYMSAFHCYMAAFRNR